MVRKLSPQRQAVLELVQREGRISPKHVGDVLGMNSGAARKLLFSMLSDGELASPERGKYTLPEAETVTFESDVTGESVDVTADVTDAGEFRSEIPILEHSPSGVYVYSERDGGMIPHEWSRERKGYR
jgi:hypothetical protein